MNSRKQNIAVLCTAAFFAGTISTAGSVAMAQSVSETELQTVGETELAAETAGAPSGDISDREIVLRVCNWEEYVDTGDWDEEEAIDLDSMTVFGENSLIDDFEEWYEETYGLKVRVEYSTFGTNEDLYNMLTLGDVYDLVCPSEYMIMKLMAEDQLLPLSDSFFDEDNEYNYYTNGVSPYIASIFNTKEINGETWGTYAAGYMWGVTGFVYNPEVVSEEAASSWQIIADRDYNRQVTIKDNVRDSYFAAVGALKSDLLTSEEFMTDPDYERRLEEEMNDTSPEMIQAVQDYLQDVKDNVYSFETDAGKADMITGKVVANYQWSGDAVYTMDQADEDECPLSFAVPKESTNIYFDGWVMLKRGIREDEGRQHAAEAFINFMSRPDNAIRNMYFIGYTSVISGGEDPLIYEYVDWNFGAEEDEEETIEYDLSYFFTDSRSGAEEDAYVITAPADAPHRQLGAQYPSEEVIARSSIMIYWDEVQSVDTNRMWINVRCFNIHNLHPLGWVCIVLAVVGLGYMIAFRLRMRRRKRERDRQMSLGVN